MVARARRAGGGKVRVSGRTAVTGPHTAERLAVRAIPRNPASWMSRYLREAALADGLCALAAALLAFGVRFDDHRQLAGLYLALSLSLPLFWLLMVMLCGGYDARIIGVGSDEFRKIVNVGLGLTAAIAVISYATKADLARGYVLVALPCATLFDLLARFALRKRLHQRRKLGSFMRRTVVVGHAAVAADLATELGRESYHGLQVVAACVTGMIGNGEIAGIPVIGDLASVPEVVASFDADTVAVLACPEMSGVRLRELAWALEKRGTDLCVAPALLDVAGPRTTIRPVAGLPLLHMDHPEFTGARRVIKAAFDRTFALAGLVLAAPLCGVLALIIAMDDGRPFLFKQVRVGKDGRTFTVYKFRTMVADAEQLKAGLASWNEQPGLLFKIR